MSIDVLGVLGSSLGVFLSMSQGSEELIKHNKTSEELIKYNNYRLHFLIYKTLFYSSLAICVFVLSFFLKSYDIHYAIQRQLWAVFRDKN